MTNTEKRPMRGDEDTKKPLPSAPGDSKNLVQTHHKRLTPLLHFTDKRQRVYIHPGFSNRRTGCLFVFDKKKEPKQEMNFHQVFLHQDVYTSCIHHCSTKISQT